MTARFSSEQSGRACNGQELRATVSAAWMLAWPLTSAQWCSYYLLQSTLLRVCRLELTTNVTLAAALNPNVGGPK